MYLMLSIMIGGMYYDIDNDQTTVQDRISILFYVVAFMVFMAIAVIPNCTLLGNYCGFFGNILYS